MRENALPAVGAQARGRFFKLGIEVFENGLHGANDKRQADEDQRDQHAERRERDLDAQRLQKLPEPAVLE